MLHVKGAWKLMAEEMKIRLKSSLNMENFIGNQRRVKSQIWHVSFTSHATLYSLNHTLSPSFLKASSDKRCGFPSTIGNSFHFPNLGSLSTIMRPGSSFLAFRRKWFFGCVVMKGWTMKNFSTFVELIDFSDDLSLFSISGIESILLSEFKSVSSHDSLSFTVSSGIMKISGLSAKMLTFLECSTISREVLVERFPPLFRVQSKKHKRLIGGFQPTVDKHFESSTCSASRSHSRFSRPHQITRFCSHGWW